MAHAHYEMELCQEGNTCLSIPVLRPHLESTNLIEEEKGKLRVIWAAIELVGELCTAVPLQPFHLSLKSSSMFMLQSA